MSVDIEMPIILVSKTRLVEETDVQRKAKQTQRTHTVFILNQQ